MYVNDYFFTVTRITPGNLNWPVVEYPWSEPIALDNVRELSVTYGLIKGGKYYLKFYTDWYGTGHAEVFGVEECLTFSTNNYSEHYINDLFEKYPNDIRPFLIQELKTLLNRFGKTEKYHDQIKELEECI